MKRILTGLVATLIGTTALFAQNGHGPNELAPNQRPIVVHRLHGAPPPAAVGNGGTTGNGINYNGGPVMVNGVNVYYIWYGDWSAHPLASGILTNFASNVGGSPYFNINTSYFDAANANVLNSVTYIKSVNSSYAAANPTNLTSGDIWNIVTKELNATLPVDPNGMYFVLTAPGVGQTNGSSTFLGNYCGWHTAATSGGTWIKYSFVGDANGIWGCTGYSGATPNGDIGADAMSSVVAHELEEATTDPLLNAWYDSSGQENADKCAWTFGTTFTEPNGSTANMTLGGMGYRIQQNWINAGGGSCGLSYATGPDYNIGFTTSSSVSVVAGATASYGLTINDLNGFNSSVGLVVSGLPANTTASFSPVSTATTSILSVVTTAATPPGTYSLTITGSGGSPLIVKTATATLTVTAPPTPDYSLSISTVTPISQGQTTGAYTVTVNPKNGFTGAVTFQNVTGLPAGASATALSPSPTASTAAFTISAAPTTKVGSYNFTVTGTSPGLTNHTVQGTLTVTTAGAMTVSVTSPAAVPPALPSLTVTRGSRGTYTVSVKGMNGFNSSTQLSVSGLPSKVSGSFSPNPVTSGNGTSTLTISAQSKATPRGNYLITITAVGGGVTAKTTATLIIN